MVLPKNHYRVERNSLLVQKILCVETKLFFLSLSQVLNHFQESFFSTDEFEFSQESFLGKFKLFLPKSDSIKGTNVRSFYSSHPLNLPLLSSAL